MKTGKYEEIMANKSYDDSKKDCSTKWEQEVLDEQKVYVQHRIKMDNKIGHGDIKKRMEYAQNINKSIELNSHN